MTPSDIRQKSARELAKGYTWGIRALEISSIAAFGVMLGALAWRLAPYALHNPWLLLSAGALGYLGADFVSGFVHWMADTWGSTEMPIIGKALIRPFREHHVDQEAITRHDFVETNGNNCLISLPTLAVALLLPLGSELRLSLFTATFLGSLVLWVFGTNQFHKWSHMKQPPPVARLLQRMHLILPPEHHALHHAPPFNRYYAITAGWVNWPLYALRFYSTLEALVTWTTGALPRRDDIGERAAREAATVLPEQQGATIEEPVTPKLS